MVAGHLREKDGYYHIVLSYIDENGKRQTPSRSTKLPVKGNKKTGRANAHKGSTGYGGRIGIPYAGSKKRYDGIA